MASKKTQCIPILITCIGLMQWCLRVVESAMWENHVPFQNMVCPGAIMNSMTSLSRTHCCVTCEQVDGCVSVFYTPDDINNCHLANANVLSNNSCISESNARHYIIRNHVRTICNEQGEYLTLLLEDGPFTYKVVHASVSRGTAQQECAASGGFLAKLSTIPRMEIMFEIMTTCAGFGQIDYWIGGSNVNATNYLADNAWTWHDGEVVNMNHTFWGTDRPNNPSSEHCIIIYVNFGWKFTDYFCGYDADYICEK